MTPSGPPLDADRLLALSYVPARRRPALAALWRLDAALGAVLSAGREPMISRIKLAWWRDALEGLDRGDAPAEPLLQAVASEILPRGVAGADLAGMTDGWGALLVDGPLEEADLCTYAARRGGQLFLLSGKLLGGVAAKEQVEAGQGWALVDFARHSADPMEADAAVAAAGGRLAGQRWPARLRPLGMLAALARRDLEPGRVRWESPGSPGRMLRMIGHRLTGT